LKENEKHFEPDMCIEAAKANCLDTQTNKHLIATGLRFESTGAVWALENSAAANIAFLPARSAQRATGPRLTGASINGDTRCNRHLSQGTGTA